jgi:hypothetical protein
MGLYQVSFEVCISLSVDIGKVIEASAGQLRCVMKKRKRQCIVQMSSQTVHHLSDALSRRNIVQKAAKDAQTGRAGPS